AQAVLDVRLTGRDAVRAVGRIAAVSPVMVVVDDTGTVVGMLRASHVIEALRAGT
ncbi:MAG: hypothetical protein HGA44_00890, partial [Cellulomonadaceae bacterium]|nr:hypothetical protein [Cellulomonadaceae bacterium]